MIKASYGYFLLFWALLIVFYFPAKDAGFVMDFAGWAQRFIEYGIRGVPFCFGWPGNQQFHLFFAYTMFAGFGATGWPYFLIYTALHAINAFLIFRLTWSLGHVFSTRFSREVALFGTLLFLLSPVQNEVVISRVCLHYLLSVGMMTYALQLQMEWMVVPKPWRWWGIQLILLCALFTLEWAMIFPVVCFLFVLVLTWKKEQLTRLPTLIRQNLIPQALLVAGYLMFNKITLGGWVGHYGEEKHLSFDLPEMAVSTLKYVSKTALLSRQWPFPYKEQIFQFLELPFIAPAIFLGWIILLVWLSRFGNQKATVQIAALYGALGLVALVPILNLGVLNLLWVENDRYGYWFSIFFLPHLVLLVSLFPYRWFLGITASILGFQLLFLVPLVQVWKENAAVDRQLRMDFRWYDQKHIFILNNPDNLKGSYLYRDLSGERGFQDALAYVERKPFEGTMYEIASYNLESWNDGVIIIPMADSTLHVSFRQYGNWWWRQGFGAQSYETEYYRFQLKEPWLYELQIKELPEEAVFIYQDSLSWKSLNWDSAFSD